MSDERALTPEMMVNLYNQIINQKMTKEKTILEIAMEDAKILKEQAIANAQKAGHDSVTKNYIDLQNPDSDNWIQTADIVAEQPMTVPVTPGLFAFNGQAVVAQTFPMMDIIPWTPLGAYDFAYQDVQPVTITEENSARLLDIWRKEQSKALEEQFKKTIRENGPLPLGEDKILCLEEDKLVVRIAPTKEATLENRCKGIVDGDQR